MGRKNKIYRSGIVHTDTAEQVLDAFRTHFSTHPPRFFGDIDSIAEFLYFQYTETNPVENETVRKSYTAFMALPLVLSAMTSAIMFQVPTSFQSPL